MSLAEVVSIPAVLPHKNADKLEIVPLKDRQFITAKGQFHPGDKAVLIPRGAVVPDKEVFRWLLESQNSLRIKPRKLRGIWSPGVLMSPSELGLDISEIVEGTDLADLIGVYDEEEFKRHCSSGRCGSTKQRCQRNHMPRSLKGWVRYLRYRVIG